jgi:PAS domain S-box-containing protein
MNDRQPALTPRSGVILILLVILGFLGNFCSISLFFGADFVFGSIAVLLVLYYYGLGFGLIAAFLVNIYCYFLWGHPFGSLTFILEALFVGYFLRSGKKNLILLDAFFWLLIGMPLTFVVLGRVMHMGAITMLFIMLKQSINGIFNALVASLAIMYLPLDKIMGRTQARRTFTLHETLFYLMAALVLFPALLLTTMEVRQEIQQMENQVVAELKGLSADIQSHLYFWYSQHLNAVTELAIWAGKSTMTPSAQLQHEVEILNAAFPDFSRLQVEDRVGTAIAFAPKINHRGQATIGLNFADQAWFKEVQAAGRPVVSEVFQGDQSVFSPMALLSVPVLRDDRFIGAATAALDLKRLYCILEPYRKFWGVSITLTDGRGRIIVSTSPARPAMEVWDLKKAGVVTVLSDSIYHWFPREAGLPSMTRWNRSLYVKETVVGPEVPWTLTIEVPVLPRQQYVYTIYVQNLAIMAILIAFALLLALPLSRWLAEPLEQLARVTADLPQKLSHHQTIDWPRSSAVEKASLISNIQAMAQVFEYNFKTLEDRGEELARTNEELQHEIQERKQIEKWLRASEQRFQDIAANASEWIWEVDAEGRYTYSSAVAEKLLGYRSEDILQKHFYDLFHPDDREVLKKGAFAIFAQQQPFRDFINRNLDAQGKTVWLLTSGIPLLDENGDLLGYRGVDRDITSIKQALAALRDSEHKYRLIVQNLPAVVFRGYADWRVEFFDEKVAELTGYTKEEFNAGKVKWSDLMFAEDLPRAREVFLRALKANKLYAREYRITKKGGEVVWIQVRGQIICNQDGTVELVNGVFFDITDRKKAEEERIKFSKLESLGLLAGGIAHDFNNLLTGILGNLSLCLMDPGIERDFQERLLEAEKACDQARVLARQLLTFAKGGSPIKKITKLDQILEESGSLGCRGSQVRYEFHLPPDLWAVEVDVGQINQVFQNIIINAVQAMPLGGIIKIYGENVVIGAESDVPLSPGSYVKIVIQDQGVGIPAEYLPQIFDPYFTTKPKGSGLGLATSYSIIKNHHGHIAVESTLKKGTTFTLYLPGMADKVTPPLQGPAELVKRNGRILVMDDEEIVQRVLGKMLSYLGYRPDFAKDGEEALNMFVAAQEAGQEFEAVILDLTVPGGMGGREAMEKLLMIDPHVKAIVSSGYFDDSVMADFQSYGFSGVICKPYKIDELGRTLNEIIHRNQGDDQDDLPDAVRWVGD